MRKSRGFMCENCESTNVIQIAHSIVDGVGSGVLCKDCNQLVINNKILLKGVKKMVEYDMAVFNSHNSIPELEIRKWLRSNKNIEIVEFKVLTIEEANKEEWSKLQSIFLYKREVS